MPRFAVLAAVFASLAAVSVRAQVKVLLVSEPAQQNMVQKFEAGIKAAEDANADLTVDIVENIKIDRSSTPSTKLEPCSTLRMKAHATQGLFHY